ncbi:hypothetical protein WR25_00969 [Diploscapter pachys]|uniref:Uncharacterized protein n=1 Tax=Diploscapter pachys TaxID=2018661 RepID=A0A2A2JVU0_9BILA|nr:hypothetical protein WR25_00969 [Diploscapter pachys]
MTIISFFHLSRTEWNRGGPNNSSIKRGRASSAYESTTGSDLAPEGITRQRKAQSMKTSNEPGLRSMLYGLASKMEKEEAEAKKLQKKIKG